MLSDPSVKLVASNFVAVKIDPAATMDSREHKSTRYVPELVVLDPSQNRVATIDGNSAALRSPVAMQQALADALAAAQSRRTR